MSEEKESKLEDLTEKQRAELIKAMVLPISRPRHYALQGKLLAYNMGIKVDISEDEWKLAEELGWVDPLPTKE